MNRNILNDLIKELKSIKFPKKNNNFQRKFEDNSIEIIFGKNKQKISYEALEVLRKAKKTENSVIFDFKIDRNIYEEVKKALENIGGKWKKQGGKNSDGSPKGAIIFDRFDPQIMVKYIIDSGYMPLKNPTAFFPTPKEVVNEMIDFVGFECDYLDRYNKNTHTILEPSAGTGGIADVLKEKCPNAQIQCIEYLSVNAELLDQKGYDVKHTDFLKYDTSQKFRYVFMNPPFNNTEYIDHIYKAYDMLETPGDLVAIIPNTVHRTDKKTTEFYNFISCNNGVIEKLPANSFEESGTKVNTLMVRLEKNYYKKKVEHSGFGSYHVWHFILIVENNFSGELLEDLEGIFKRHSGNEESLKEKLKKFIDDSIRYIRKEQETLFCLDTSDYNEIIEYYLELYGDYKERTK